MKNSTVRHRRLAAPAFLALAALTATGATAAPALAAPTAQAGPATQPGPAGTDGGGPGWRQSAFHLGSSSMTMRRTASGFTGDDTAFFTQETVSLSPEGIDHLVTSSHS